MTFKERIRTDQTELHAKISSKHFKQSLNQKLYNAVYEDLGAAMGCLRDLYPLRQLRYEISLAKEAAAAGKKVMRNSAYLF